MDTEQGLICFLHQYGTRYRSNHAVERGGLHFFCCRIVFQSNISTECLEGQRLVGLHHTHFLVLRACNAVFYFFFSIPLLYASLFLIPLFCF